MNRNDLPPLMPPPGELPPDTPRGFMARFRNYFLTGLIVAGPIAITFYLTWWFVTWVDGLVRPFVPIAYRPETYHRLLLLCAQEQDHRSRDERRRRRDPDHVLRRGAARLRPAEENRSTGRIGKCRA